MDQEQEPATVAAMRRLSPLRNSTSAQDVDGLVDEQLTHFGIDSGTPFGRHLARITRRLYECQADVDALWRETLSAIHGLDRAQRISRFNAKKFLSFQLAKLLDTLQNPSRRAYQSLGYTSETITAKGQYPLFDNITAIFSATPVITRTATYIYACAEWIEDAFQGREMMLEIYSRLLNPTSIALANFVVDLEAGPYASNYLAWNFNSGMAAIDGVLSHLLGRDDILISARNIYGGAHQLIHDWYAKDGNLAIGIESFSGQDGDAFLQVLDQVEKKYADRLAAGRRIYVYLESPCNPHGDVLDVPEICRLAHERGLRVILDATVGTPFLYRPLQRQDPAERPDFIIHSYTKDLSGTGSVIAGTVIGRNEDMFMPKGEQIGDHSWADTMFWNVYYVKGAFLNSDAAFEVLQGMKTLTARMLSKCINTIVLARFFHSHPSIHVHSNVLEGHRNAPLRERYMFLQLPAPLFTIDMESVNGVAFHRFFDALAPTFSHMISLGQSNTIVSCPALTTHSELNEEALRSAGIQPTTIRFAVGDEDPGDLIAHFVHAARLAIDPLEPGFSDQFLDADEVDRLIRETYIDVHGRYAAARPSVGRRLEEPIGSIQADDNGRK